MASMGGYNPNKRLRTDVDQIQQAILSGTVGGGTSPQVTQDLTSLKSQVGTGTFEDAGQASSIAAILGLTNSQGLRSLVRANQQLHVTQSTTNSTMQSSITALSQKIGVNDYRGANGQVTDMGTIIGYEGNESNSMRLQLEVNRLAIAGLEDNQTVTNDAGNGTSQIREIVGPLVTQGLRGSAVQQQNQINTLIGQMNTLLNTTIPRLLRASSQTMYTLDVLNSVSAINGVVNFNHCRLTEQIFSIGTYKPSLSNQGSVLTIPAEIQRFKLTVSMNISFTGGGGDKQVCVGFVRLNADGSGGDFFGQACISSRNNYDRELSNVIIANLQGANDSRSFAFGFDALVGVNTNGFNSVRVTIEGCHD